MYKIYSKETTLEVWSSIRILFAFQLFDACSFSKACSFSLLFVVEGCLRLQFVKGLNYHVCIVP